MAASDSPLKVSHNVKELVKYGALVFGCTQGEFVQRAVAGYLREHADDVAQKAEELRQRMAELEKLAR